MLLNEILKGNSYMDSSKIEYDKPKQSKKGTKMQKLYARTRRAGNKPIIDTEI